MSEAASQYKPYSSPLVRSLIGLLDHTTPDARPGQAQRLGDLLDFADTVRLSTSLDALPTLARQSGEATTTDPTAAEVTAAFSLERAAILAWALASFAGGGHFRRVPLPAPPAPGDDPESFHPYRQFYIAQQREIQFRIDALQRETRLGVASLSPRLCRLAELDAVLDDALGAKLRALFQRVPSLLARRYSELSQSMAHGADMTLSETDAGLPLHRQICTEMQTALVAEVDARLLPVRGLVAALAEKSGTANE